MKNAVILVAAMAMTLGATSVQAKGDRGGEKPAFTQIDANGDGQVTQAEMQAFGEARKAERFSTTDTNNDGLLSAAEIAAAAEQRAGDRATKRAERMIERLDTNKDGSISQAELDSHEGGRRQGKGRNMDRMFDRLDADDNGTLSQAEYDAAGKRGGGRK